MDKARGGELVTNVMTHFIYPEIPGFEEAGGLAGPKVDYNEHPQGDMAVAEKYMKAAGYPSGKYTGSETLQVVGSTGSPAPEDAEIANQALKSLGFKTKLNLVDQSVMYSKYCGVRHRRDRRLPERRLDRRLRRPAGGAERAVRRRIRSSRTGPTPTGARSTTRQINTAMESGRKRRRRRRPARTRGRRSTKNSSPDAVGRPVRLGQAAVHRVQRTSRASATCGTSVRGTTTTPR